MLSIVGRLAAERDHLGVDLRLNAPVGRADVLAEAPDVVITATGGFPDSSFLEAGANLVSSTWDVLSGNASISGSVLVYDDHGGEHAPPVIEYLSERGVTDVELVTPDRLVAQDLAATTGPAYLNHTRREPVRTVDSIVFEHGVVPNGEPYLSLRDESTNGGVIDIAALTNGLPQPPPGDGFVLYRVGDAVASRGIAAGLYEARRLCRLL